MKSLKHRLIAFALVLAAALMPAGAAFAESDIELITSEMVTEPLDLPSGDLFYRYMLRKGSGIRPRGTLAGNELTGNDAVVYGIVKPGIESVAAGRSSSTAFSITLDDLGIGNDGTYSNVGWTAAELGVPALLNDKGRLTGEAFSALLVKAIQVNTGAVMHALLFDCPYDLFWFDKTKGMGTSMSYGTSGSGDGMRIYLSASGFSLNFAVASAYAGTGDYTTNAVNIARANAAAANARSFVTGCSGMSDYQKLTAYRDKICTEVTYDRDAADDDSTPYGDPWQLVYVFDGDSSTNVVCEGYSKAFQYLCDLSHFAGSVQCYSVSGTMSGGSGEGGHMWNLVNMSDGVSYLVDVTNCDSGSAGYPDKLFMKGATLTGTPDPYYVNVGTVSSPHNITYTYDGNVRTRWSTAILTPSATDYNDTTPVLSGLEITVSPAKTDYIHGEAFDPAGMVLTATYSDGTSATIADYAISYAEPGRTALRMGDTSVTISYGGLTATQEVTVGAKALEIAGLMAVDRVYIPDDVSVALTGGTLQGVVAGDDVTAAMPASGTLADANAGQARPVSVPAIVLSGADASNYTLNQPEGLTANIARADLGSAEVTLSQTVFLYDGAQKRPGVQQVTLNGCTLTAGQDYVIEGYEGGQAIGDAAVIVTGLGNYQNSARAAYRVVSISEVDIRIEPEAQSFVYDLTAHEPAIVVSLGGEPLDESAYTVVYRDNIYPGTGTVSVLSDAESAGAAAVFRFPIADRGWTAPAKPSDGAGWAVPPEATSALESEALAGTAFAAVDLSGTRCASIGERAFSGMDGLEAVLMPASLASMAPDAFDGVERGQVTLCFPDGVNPNLSIGDEGSGTSTALDRLKAWAFESGVFLELDSYENP